MGSLRGWQAGRSQSTFRADSADGSIDQESLEASVCWLQRPHQ